MTAQPGNPPAQGDTLRIGATLHAGRYCVRDKLGQGGMGAVYLAEDTLLPGRLVAVKENSDASADAQSQFKREALLLARLRHPNLPQVTDYFVAASGKQYLVMDYVPGDNLMELMRKRQGALPVDEALAIVAQVMHALAYMHTWRDPDSGRMRPIIHRDIKPANIKRTPEGRVVLVDFGIAKVDSNTMTGTAVSAKALTPGYAPLEQYGGGTDARSDIYALGATLYALLTGKAPPSATDMAMAGSKQRTPLLNNLRSFPPAVVKVIERAMQSLPEGRYQSIAEMHQALYHRPLAQGDANAPTVAGKQATRSRWPALVLGVLALLLAGGVGWVLAGQTGGRTAPPTTVATPAPLSPAPSMVAAVRATESPLPVATATAALPTPAPPAVATSTASPTPVPTATGTATPDATATAFEQEVLRRVHATQTAAASTVLATQAAQTATATALVTATPAPTATPSATATAPPPATSTPTSAPPECQVVSPSLNLRSGPGVVYDPPLASLPQGATLIAIGRTVDVAWLAVDVPSLGQQGWVNADASYVTCTGMIAGLPSVEAPPTPTPLPTATPLPQLVVDAQASSGNPVRVQYAYAGNGLAPGQLVYADRGYTYSGVPASLMGATYLATPNNDAETEENNYQLVITINRPATVLVAYSDGYTVRPGWLQAFTDTGLDLTFTDQKGNTVILSVYARATGAGQVVLGGNTPVGSDRHSMYTVVIQ